MRHIQLTASGLKKFSKAQPGDIIEIPFKGERILVIYCKDGMWRDKDGGIYGFPDKDESSDPVVRCGVYPFSLPVSHPLTDACRAHDYMYSCPAFQASYTREEADKILKNHIKLVGRDHWYGILAWPFYALVRVFGGLFWENKKTNK